MPGPMRTMTALPDKARPLSSAARGAAGPIQSFTLVELMIVVVLLGILAAVIIPQFSDSVGDAKTNSLMTDLALVRKQLQVYRHQHRGAFPSLAQFDNQMTGKTLEDGTVSGAGPLGPYLKQIPINPFTTSDTIGTGGVGSSSWYYNESTGEFRANCHAGHSTL